jgi:hypothetical protein
MRRIFLLIMLIGICGSVNAQDEVVSGNLSIAKNTYYKGVSWQNIQSRFFSYGGHLSEAKWLINNIPESGGRFLIIAGPEGMSGSQHIAFSIEGNKNAIFNGNVGIGTTPSHKLSVSSSDNQILELSSETSGTWMDFENTRASIGSRVWSIGHHGSSGGFGVYQRDNTNEYRLFINESGDIGIGTRYTKGFKLAVKGNVGAEEVQVKANYWSDFVFEDDYQLKDLEEVESFIEENKHLPDIPSENEVLKNGIQLGEMDAKLLQKIEELTLYMIEQNKKIEALLERVNVLENKNEQLKGELKAITAQ